LLEPRRGHFALESGHHGELWLELESLFVWPSRTARFAGELARRLAPAGIEAVRERGLMHTSLATLPNPLWEPAACPLCAAGTPLDDV
jgi:hypothetical protein